MSDHDERYTDWHPIGEGAFGAVYRVTDTILQRKVAIKLLKKEHLNNASYVKTLYQEVNISRDLRHAHICPIHDLYQGEQGIGTVMDLVEGQDLTHWLQENTGQLLDTAPQRLNILMRMTEALAFAHTRIIHRDLKPDNVFLVHKDPNCPMIMDFGVSNIGQSVQADAVVGTYRYMSPEQLEDPHKVDGRSDLFSLGIMAYEMFTYQTPPTSLRWISKTKTVPKLKLFDIPKPSSFCAAVPPDLDHLILQMMAYRQEDRPESAQEVAQALTAIRLLSPDQIPTPAGFSRPATVNIPGGTGYQGSPPGVGADNECPARTVTLSPFVMAVHPVINRDYRHFLNTTGHTPPPPPFDALLWQDDHPVVGVTWHDAMAYARWIGGHLPTEAQWEYAAKGGNSFPVYPWGDTPPSALRANIGRVCPGTSPVTACPSGANPFGVMGLCGNVWEWCRDVWNTTRSLEDEPLDPMHDGEGPERVLRGGGFDSYVTQGRCTFRFHAAAEARGPSIGFRIIFQ